MDELSRLLAAAAKRIEENKLYSFLPYGHPDTLCPHGFTWQAKHEAGEWHEWSNSPWQYDFLNSTTAINAILAGNRLGKSDIAMDRMAYHATGYYPTWYKGRKFKGNITLWSCTLSSEFSRDVHQKKLLGSSDYASDLYGTGLIPRDAIIGKPQYRQAGVSDTIDYIQVRRRDGSIAELYFKSYDQGWRKFGGRDVHHSNVDEPPDETNKKEAGIWAEIMARSWAVDGTIDVTMTPRLRGQKLTKFLKTSPMVTLFTASMYDVPHISPANRQAAIDALDGDEEEIATRIYGKEYMGEGRVFMTNISEITVKPFEIPAHFARIAGCDFGINHPAAGAWLAYDRETDTIYVYDCYRMRKKTVEYHAYMFRSRGSWIPVAWPHDGMKPGNSREGSTLANDYRSHGVNMLPNSARYKHDVGGAQPVEPIFLELNERMQTGRFRIFETCRPLIDECMGMHRDETGKIVNLNDDIVKAVCYATMDRRYAIPYNRAFGNPRPSYARPLA